MPVRIQRRGTVRRWHLARVWLSGWLVVALSALGPSPAGSTDLSSSSTAVLNVIAGENFWGSLASQLGGKQVRVTSIVSDPNADPHQYEISAANARAFAAANYVILNGAGYDDWANKLLAAQPGKGRKVFTVATLLGKRHGDNPHFWYNPSYVFEVIDQITGDYNSIEPKKAAYFAARHAAVESALAPYRSRLAYITEHFSGTAVASTESIFEYMAQYLQLKLITPYPFMKAVAEGGDPPASSVATFDQQIQAKAFKVLVYNIQTVTPLTTAIKEQTAQKHVPIVGLSETIQPPVATFEQWMDRQLDSLKHALTASVLAK